MKRNCTAHFNLSLLSAFLLLITATSCQEVGNQENREKTGQKHYTKEELMRINNARKQAEERRINKYIQRSGLPFKRTNTGLRYHIYETSQEDVPTANDGQIAAIDFAVVVLNGDTVYRSKPGRPAEFLIGKDHVESGLHEGITYLKPGEKALLVLPPHLAHGLAGDLKKIPMNATIIYDLHLREVR